jgi:hypothetical protein
MKKYIVMSMIAAFACGATINAESTAQKYYDRLDKISEDSTSETQQLASDVANLSEYDMKEVIAYWFAQLVGAADKVANADTRITRDYHFHEFKKLFHKIMNVGHVWDRDRRLYERPLRYFNEENGKIRSSGIISAAIGDEKGIFSGWWL